MLDISLDTKKKLIEVGFLAALSGQQEEADAIFEGVMHMGNHPIAAPYVGKSVAAITCEHYQDAIDILLQGLEVLPDNEDLNAILALAYHASGQAKSKNKLLQKLQEHKGPVGALAACLLNEKGA